MMPATKNIFLKSFFSIFLLSTFFSCIKETKPTGNKDPYEITSISLSDIGGHLGSYRIIKVTRDSITAEKGTTSNQIHKKWASTISPDAWRQLASSIHITDLDYIKSSPSRQPMDGIDETFQIRTPKKSHIYVNAYVDTVHYQQLQQLKEQLNNILPEEYK